MAHSSKYKFLGFCIALALWGCTPVIYYPNCSNVPLPYEKNNLKASAGISSSGYYSEGSYALGNHSVICADFCKANNTFLGTKNFGNNIFGEIGGGYYGRFKKNGRFEFLGCFGTENTSSNYSVLGIYLWGPPPPSTHYNVYNSFKRATIQSDIGLFSKNAEIGLSMKLSYLSNQNLRYIVSDYYSEMNKDSNAHSISIPDNLLFAEPLLFINLGIRQIKFHFCYGFSYVLNYHNNLWVSQNLSPAGIVSLGVTVDILGKKMNK